VGAGAAAVATGVWRIDRQSALARHTIAIAQVTMVSLLVWMERNCNQKLSLSVMARHARMSTRTLSRRFREQVGMSPVQWLAKARFVARNICWKRRGFLLGVLQKLDSDPLPC
jgi:transcriptional regulator GlxA family with amidase domain